MTYFGAAFFASRCFSLFLAVAGGESQKISQFGRVPCSLEQTGDIRDIRCIRCVAKCGEMLQIVQAIGFIGFIGCSEPVKILKKQGRSAGPSSKIRKIQRYPKYSRLNMLALVPSTAISVAFVVRRVLSCAVVLSRERGLLRTSVRDRSINGFNGFNGFVLTTSRTWSTVR